MALLTSAFPPHAGAPARAALRLARELARAGVEVVIFVGARGDDPPLRRPEESGGFHVHAVLSEVEGLALIDLLHAERPFDLVHAFSLEAAAGVSAWAARHGVPMVVGLRREREPFDSRTIDALRHAAWLAAVSERALRRVRDILGDDAPGSTIPESLDPDRLSEGDAWHATPDSAGVVATACGRLAPRHVAAAIEAYGGIAPAIRRRLIVMAESVPMLQPPPSRPRPRTAADETAAKAAATKGAETIEEFLHARGLSSEVECLSGGDEAIWRVAMRRVRVFVAASADEDAQQAALQAAAAGIPVVALDGDEVPDALARGGAWLVERGDPARLSVAIETLLTDDARAAALSASARHAARPCTPDAECAHYLAIYRRLAASSAGVRA